MQNTKSLYPETLYKASNSLFSGGCYYWLEKSEQMNSSLFIPIWLDDVLLAGLAEFALCGTLYKTPKAYVFQIKAKSPD